MSLCAADEPPKPSAQQIKFFEDRIRPVLIEHCYECHSEEAASSGKLRGQLKLDSRPAGLRGGESGDQLLAMISFLPNNGSIIPAGRDDADVLKRAASPAWDQCIVPQLYLQRLYSTDSLGTIASA
jgi:hypothetical protein